MKFFIFYVFFAAFFSCDNENKTAHPLVGLWQVQQIFQQGNELELDKCALLTTSEFKTGGIFFEKRYLERILGCSLNNESGTWSETSENTVRLSFDNRVTAYQNTKFIIDDNMMTLTDGDGSETFAIVFKKVEWLRAQLF